MRKILLSLLCLVVMHGAFGQTITDKVKVFLDCTEPWLCDFDYVRTEIKSVDFVRDRFVADVHILVNTQRSSSGGTQAEVDFIGQKRFASLVDTLIYFNDPTATEDEQRKKLVQFLKLGLTRFVAKTSYASQLEIGFTSGGEKDSIVTHTRDPWN